MVPGHNAMAFEDSSGFTVSKLNQLIRKGRFGCYEEGMEMLTPGLRLFPDGV